MAKEWFLLQYKPNSHKIATRNLVRQGFELFLPVEEVTTRRASRFETKTRPLFSGYMFIAFDPDTAPWRKVNSTYGVSRLVSFHGALRAVPASLINGLQVRCDDTGRLMSEEVTFAKGDEVRIKTGPFANFVATVDRMDRDLRTWVLLDLMGQQTRVQLKPSQLAAS